MHDLTLKDFISVGGVWGRIEALYPFPFITEYSPEHLDQQLVLNYGDKLIFSKIPSLGLDFVAKDAIFTYKQKWLDLISIESLQFNIGADKTHKVSETLTHAETRKGVNETLNKVSAFNTDELITNDGNNSKSNDDIDYNKAKTLTDEVISLNQAFKNLNVKQKNVIIAQVNKDLSSLLTLDIY